MFQKDAIETPNGLLLPDGRLMRPPVSLDGGNQHFGALMSRSEWDQLHAVMRSQFFIFRNDPGEYGERMICKAKNPDGTWRGCGNKHSHITSMCVEMPFRGGSGLEQGFYLSFRAATDEARRNSIMLAMSKLPDLAEGHPFTARDLAPEHPGENWLAVLISLPEPITKQKALDFANKINDRNPVFKFCTLEKCIDFMTASPDCTRGVHTFESI